MRRLLCCLPLLLALLAPPVEAQRAAFTPMPVADPGPGAVTLRVAGAAGGIVVAMYGTFLVLYGGEHDVPPAAILLLPVVGASGGSYLAGRATGASGTYVGAVMGTVIGMVPGAVVLAAAGSSVDAETSGALLFVGGAAVGAAVGYGSPRLALGFIRAPGTVSPALRVRVAL